MARRRRRTGAADHVVPGDLRDFGKAAIVGAGVHLGKLAALRLAGLILRVPIALLLLGLGWSATTHVLFGVLGGLLGALALRELRKIPMLDAQARGTVMRRAGMTVLVLVALSVVAAWLALPAGAVTHWVTEQGSPGKPFTFEPSGERSGGRGDAASGQDLRLADVVLGRIDRTSAVYGGEYPDPRSIEVLATAICCSPIVPAAWWRRSPRPA